MAWLTILGEGCGVITVFVAILKNMDTTANRFGKRKMASQTIAVVSWLIIIKFFELSIITISVIDGLILISLVFAYKSLEDYAERIVAQ